MALMLEKASRACKSWRLDVAARQKPSTVEMPEKAQPLGPQDAARLLSQASKSGQTALSTIFNVQLDSVRCTKTPTIANLKMPQSYQNRCLTSRLPCHGVRSAKKHAPAVIRVDECTEIDSSLKIFAHEIIVLVRCGGFPAFRFYLRWLSEGFVLSSRTSQA